MTTTKDKAGTQAEGTPYMFTVPLLSAGPLPSEASFGGFFMPKHHSPQEFIAPSSA